MKKLIFCFAALLTCTAASHATNILITQNQGGGLGSAVAFDTVFGSGSYNSINDYASVDTGAIFSSANSFVFLDGGNDTDIALNTFLATSGADILNWVSNGGSLFIQSGGWDESVAFGPATIAWSFSSFNLSGDLTAAGSGAFTQYGISASSYSGFFLSNTMIEGPGLTSFMEGVELDDGAGGIIGGGSILAGTQYGNGYIMYSGLADTDPGLAFNDAAPVLANAIAYTAAQAHTNTVPEPISLLLLAGALTTIGLIGRKKTY